MQKMAAVAKAGIQATAFPVSLYTDTAQLVCLLISSTCLYTYALSPQGV